MIDTKELRMLAQEFKLAGSPMSIQTTQMNELLDRLEATESECLEQARLNGMGGEREAALLAKLEAAEKDIAIKEEVIDSLAAVIKRLDAQCDAAEKSDAESIAMYRKARDERDALRAKIEAMEKIVSAAQNLVKMKGRHNTKIAYRQLVAALEEFK